MDDRLLNIIFAKDEVTWHSMLYQLIKSENMNPWDIDVSQLTRKYIDMLKKLKEMDFHVSGKVVLAAAILLKIKSIKLVSDDMSELDNLLKPQEEPQEFFDDLEHGQTLEDWTQRPDLIPRTPQPRHRKVSIYDLVSALQKALEVRHRRMIRHMPTGRLEVPEKKIDITKIMEEVYDKIINYLKTEQQLTYRKLVEGQDKKNKILTFISLLTMAHYETRKVDLVQQELFGDIEIKLPPQSLPAS
ncbi:MAG TPA: ScpA family protein [Candidatus Nanoarchaeia archaeon]|nr:ScpA family protein [Candidatus Nanoarchaeia archaeon]